MTPPCCICPPDCQGVDAEDAAKQCNVMCAICLHGCPALDGETCCQEETR